MTFRLLLEVRDHYRWRLDGLNSYIFREWYYLHNLQRKVLVVSKMKFLEQLTANVWDEVVILVRNRGFLVPSSNTILVPGPAGLKQNSFAYSAREFRSFRESLDYLTCPISEVADHEPYEFFYPWVGAIRNKFSNDLLQSERALGLYFKIKDYDEEGLEKIAGEHRFNWMFLDQLVSNLNNFVRFHPEAKTLGMMILREDFEFLRIRSEKLQRRIQWHQNWLGNMLALKASRKSIEQSICTKRLTQLAYMFLLSLSTGILSMNIAQIQNVPFRSFFVISAITLMMSLILWLLVDQLFCDEWIKIVQGIGKAYIIM